MQYLHHCARQGIAPDAYLQLCADLKPLPRPKHQTTLRATAELDDRLTGPAHKSRNLPFTVLAVMCHKSAGCLKPTTQPDAASLVWKKILCPFSVNVGIRRETLHFRGIENSPHGCKSHISAESARPHARPRPT